MGEGKYLRVKEMISSVHGGQSRLRVIDKIFNSFTVSVVWVVWRATRVRTATNQPMARACIRANLAYQVCRKC